MLELGHLSVNRDVSSVYIRIPLMLRLSVHWIQLNIWILPILLLIIYNG